MRLVLLAPLVMPLLAIAAPDYATIRRQAALAQAKDYQRSVESIQRAAAKRPSRKTSQVCEADGSCRPGGLQVHLHSPPGTLTFCRDCDASDHGSFAITWPAAHGQKEHSVVAELVYAVPNDASSELVDAVRGAAVLVDRGAVAIVHKVRRAQEAGAVAVIVADTMGDCDDDLDCGRLGARAGGMGFAAGDDREPWEHVFVPVVLISRATTQRLVLQMDATEVRIPGLGPQLVTQ